MRYICLLLFVPSILLAWEDTLEITNDKKRRITSYFNDENMQFSRSKYYEFDCVNENFKILKAASYQFPDLRGKSLDENADPEKVVQPKPNSNEYILLKEVCDYK
ncbi:hypothetical protein OAO78_00085 [Methylophilaceae bacterium]|jgi:hypothetical protein|nr:hypothetical protein [Methylophilaceae bacterium]MDC0626047.1 hypothetical protein [Methylophilaceae bacterium]MDC0977348.1 hypothetical protein [Methylophilaceae bacterium]